jgi:hypothetical protein
MAVAAAQGRRLARVAQVIGLAQERGRLDMRAGVAAPQDGSRGRTLKPSRVSNATGIAHRLVFLSSRRPEGSSESVACLDYSPADK